ncbi:MAG: lipoyl protein ligase domain-containing protein [Candidatus Dormibacteria bacterium]
MDAVRLLDLGLCSYTESQILYHAVADSLRPGDPNTIILCRPRRPYVCIGRHQELSREVDVDACRRLGLPILRREVGGGAVYLDRDQLFFQIVCHPQDVPSSIARAFEHFARAPVECYRALGVKGAHFAPVNDLQVEGRKIGGLGAATIGQAFVFVGSIISAFNARAAASVLLIPDEKMRDKVAATMEAYVSSLERELGRRPPPRVVSRELVAAFESQLGVRLEPGQLGAAERETYRRWVRRMRSATWLNDVRLPDARLRSLKITGNVRVGQGTHKARGGLLRATVMVAAGHIAHALVSGDFYAVGDAVRDMEKAIVGSAELEQVRARIQSAWLPDALPGVAQEDLVEVVRLALEPGAQAATR